MIEMPQCPVEFPPRLADLVRECGLLWRKSPDRPHPDSSVEARWDATISAWVEDEALPLFVRKFKDNRGAEILHRSGRVLVPVDNSPAQWAYGYACSQGAIHISGVRSLVAADQIPIAMIHKKIEKDAARFRCTLGRAVNLNARGWKLAHIRAVGLKTRTPLQEIPIEDITEHFRRLMSPGNMFVVPKQWAGIAEVPEFIEAFASGEYTV